LVLLEESQGPQPPQRPSFSLSSLEDHQQNEQNCPLCVKQKLSIQMSEKESSYLSQKDQTKAVFAKQFSFRWMLFKH
jgi:hypothetical protein